MGLLSQPGKYIATVYRPENGWLDKSKSGTEYIRIPLEIHKSLDGDDAQVGRYITYRGYLSEKTMQRTIETLAQAFECIIDVEAFANDDVENIIGKQVRITCEEEEYNGRTSIKVKWLNPLKGGKRAAESNMDDTEKLLFAKRVSGKAKKYSTEALASLKQEIGRTIDDDDQAIPF